MPNALAHALIAHADSVFHGPNGDYPAVLESIAGLTVQQAAWRPAPGANSIWQIVEHLAASKQWQLDMLEQGQAEPHPWTEPAGDEPAWLASVSHLKDAHARLKAALARLSDADLLQRPAADTDRTLLDLILSSGSAHEAHHSGQISHLRGLQHP